MPDERRRRITSMIAFLTTARDEPERARMVIRRADQIVEDMWSVYGGARIRGGTKEPKLALVANIVEIALLGWKGDAPVGWKDDYADADAPEQKRRREWAIRELERHADPAFAKLRARDAKVMRDTFARFRPHAGHGGHGVAAVAADLVFACAALDEATRHRTGDARDTARTRLRRKIETARKKLRGSS
jgi:hypothetical protein